VTTFYLIRHGANDFIGKQITGWMPGVHLNSEGRQQASGLVERLAREGIQQIIASPLERCRETATPLAEHLKLNIQIEEMIGEVRFGDWTGKTLTELQTLPEWKQFNQFRIGTRVPNGEMMIEVQARMVSAIQRLHTEFAGQRIALFGHADPIRVALMYYLGMPLDFVQRIDISPASISILRLDNQAAQVCRLNG
jgi:probable phosphomutase (TIGR03848 family)